MLYQYVLNGSLWSYAYADEPSLCNQHHVCDDAPSSCKPTYTLALPGTMWGRWNSVKGRLEQLVVVTSCLSRCLLSSCHRLPSAQQRAGQKVSPVQMCTNHVHLDAATIHLNGAQRLR
jgi:hypothetical protein